MQEKQSHYHQPLVLHNNLLPIKDILEFASQPIYEPNYFYRNLLYIYPLAINLCGANSRAANSAANSNFGQSLSGQSGTGSSLNAGSANSASSQSLLNSSSARNIAIKVNFMKGKKIRSIFLNYKIDTIHLVKNTYQKLKILSNLYIFF